MTTNFWTFTEVCAKVSFICLLFLNRRSMIYFILVACVNLLFRKDDRWKCCFISFNIFIFPTLRSHLLKVLQSYFLFSRTKTANIHLTILNLQYVFIRWDKKANTFFSFNFKIFLVFVFFFFFFAKRSRSSRREVLF